MGFPFNIKFGVVKINTHMSQELKRKPKYQCWLSSTKNVVNFNASIKVGAIHISISISVDVTIINIKVDVVNLNIQPST